MMGRHTGTSVVGCFKASVIIGQPQIDNKTHTHKKINVFN